MIIGLYLVNNNSIPGLECSGRTKQILQWCVLIADQITPTGNDMGF